mmetsp:Transcript_36647/g.44816  ORF Transcript_36647/g.44816 Transcript_36647/m.44816 type:complete len:392 (+) Transcript_36647:104-1279(+)
MYYLELSLNTYELFLKLTSPCYDVTAGACVTACHSSEVAVAGGHEVGHVDHSVGVAPLVVVPGDDLHEAGGQSDAGAGVEDRRAGVGGEVLGHDCVLGVAKNALHLVLRGSLDAGLDLIVRSVAGESDGEVDDGDVSGGHAEGHAGQLAVELGDDLADGLGGARGRGNDVCTGGTARTPVLATHSGAIDGQLVDRHGVDGRHETLLNAVGVVEDLGDGGEAVSRAGGVRDDVHAGLVLLVVDTHDEDGRAVLGRGRDDGLLCAALEVSAGLGLVAENASALGDVVSADAAPRDLGGIGLLEDVDLFAVDLDAAIGLLDGALEAAVNRVVFEEIDQVVEIHEWVVDGHDAGFVSVVGESGSKSEPADSAEAVDTESDGHCGSWCVLDFSLYF